MEVKITQAILEGHLNGLDLFVFNGRSKYFILIIRRKNTCNLRLILHAFLLKSQTITLLFYDPYIQILMTSLVLQ